MKKLVERSPMSPHNSGRIYSGEKQTETYAIDGRTGDILRIFRTGGGAKMMVDTRRCKPSHTDDLEEDECDSKASDITILVARTGMRRSGSTQVYTYLLFVNHSLYCHC